MSPLALVIDDEEPVRVLMRINLEAAGFEVVEAAGHIEAGNAIADRSPDVILLDLVLHGKDGWSLLGELRSNPDSGRVPVVVISARAGRTEEGRALAAGAHAYVAKPFDPERLVDIVRSAVRP